MSWMVWIIAYSTLVLSGLGYCLIHDHTGSHSKSQDPAKVVSVKNNRRL